MNKHMPYDLAQMQSLPLEAKILMTKRRIRAWYEYWEGLVYTSLSGGIDSTVMKHIIDSMYDDVPSMFSNTGLEYPEIQRFVKDIKAGKWACFNSDVTIVRPEMRFDEVLKKHGYPVISKHVSQVIDKARKSLEIGGNGGIRLQMIEGCFVDPKTGKLSQYNIPQYKYLFESDIPISAVCCDVMKKLPAHKYESETGRKPFIGTMADESRNRKRVWEKYGCNAYEKENPSSQPLSFWTKQDILHYIKKYDVPYCPVYGDIQVKPPEGTEEGQINVIDYLGCYEPEDTLETTGCDRTGCIFCMFGITQDGCPNRFQRLKETHPRQYEYCIGGGEFVTKAYVKTSSEWREFEFIDEDGKPLTPEQIEKFIETHENDPDYRFDRKWQPTKEGLGLGKVLDYIGVNYE